ncbi:MAG: hypothetical protein ICV79_00455 [Flavisolibacter sp.]|nr:hypothetical protein [Flavisolibacter sp.]
MFLRMYLADHLIDELPVFPNLLPSQQHHELYIKGIVSGLKEKYNELISNTKHAPKFFLEGVSSKMNSKTISPDEFQTADRIMESALNRKDF